MYQLALDFSIIERYSIVCAPTQRYAVTITPTLHCRQPHQRACYHHYVGVVLHGYDVTKTRSQVFPADAKITPVESASSNSKVVSLVLRQLWTQILDILSQIVAQIDVHVLQCAGNLSIDLSRHDHPCCDCADLNSGRLCDRKIGAKEENVAKTQDDK